MAKLSVHLVAWNGEKYIPYLFESLRAQTFKDWELLVIENGSDDNTLNAIKTELENFDIPNRVIALEKNIGFAPGHNMAVKETSAPYFQLLNQDMYLAPEYFERIIEAMDNNPEAGAAQGLLLMWNFADVANSGGLTTFIDTMGLKVDTSRRVVDWNTGKKMEDIKIKTENRVKEIFGVSGALPILRRSIIEKILFEGQMFDEDLFSYKEDVDLAFRIRSAGMKAYLVPRAKAWHDRSAAGHLDKSDSATIKNRETKSDFINYHSYKNHLMVLIKNEHYANFLRDCESIVWYELKKFAYLLFTDRKTLKGLLEVKRLWPMLMKKRKQVMENYKIKSKEMRKWYV